MQAILDGTQELASFDYLGNRIEQKTLTLDVQAPAVRSGYSFDARGLPQQDIHEYGPQSTPLAGFAHSHDAAGNLVASVDLLFARSHTWSYDSADRLVSSDHERAGGVDEIQSYQLDLQGNRLQVQGGPGAGVYQMDTSTPPADYQRNQYTLTPFDARTYDENGNLSTSLQPQSAPDTHLYDHRNRLVQFDTDPFTIKSIRYDVLGRKIQETVTGTGAGTTHFFFSGMRMIEEASNDGGGGSGGIADGSFEGQAPGQAPDQPWTIDFGTGHVINPDQGVNADGGMPTEGSQWAEITALDTDNSSPPSNPGGQTLPPVGGAGFSQAFSYGSGSTVVSFDAAFLRNEDSASQFNDWLSVDVTDGTTWYNLYYADTYTPTVGNSVKYGFAMTAVANVTADLAALFPGTDASTVFTIQAHVGNAVDNVQPSLGYFDNFNPPVTGGQASSTTWVWRDMVSACAPCVMTTGTSHLALLHSRRGDVAGIVDSSGMVLERYEYRDYGEVLDGATGLTVSVSALGNRFYGGGREYDLIGGHMLLGVLRLDTGTKAITNPKASSAISLLSLTMLPTVIGFDGPYSSPAGSANDNISIMDTGFLQPELNLDILKRLLDLQIVLSMEVLQPPDIRDVMALLAVGTYGSNKDADKVASRPAAEGMEELKNAWKNGGWRGLWDEIFGGPGGRQRKIDSAVDRHHGDGEWDETKEEKEEREKKKKKEEEEEEEEAKDDFWIDPDPTQFFSPGSDYFYWFWTPSDSMFGFTPMEFTSSWLLNSQFGFYPTNRIVRFW